MKRLPHIWNRAAAIWVLITLVAFVVSISCISVPEALAQGAAQEAAQEAAQGTAQDEAGEKPQTAVSPADAKRYAQILQNMYTFILANYVDEVNPTTLYESAMKGMLNSLGDQHTIFLDESMMADMMRETKGSYAGVGIYISKQAGSVEENGPRYIEAVSPIEGSPAWKAGVRPGDLIIAINGESTAELNADQASSKIRGEIGTKVTLTFRRGGSYEFDIEFVRASVEIPAVKSALIAYKGYKIGYIRLTDWIPQTRQKMKDALDDLTKKGADRLIVDVRSNPGGLLSSVIDVSDLFLTSGPIVSTRGRHDADNEVYSAKPDIFWARGKPVVVMINRGSASASEIFAGAMKDTKTALLVGEKSYGKGSVQQIFPLDKTGFKLTVARYYTPSGVNIDKAGIEPDIEMPDIVFTEAMLKTLQKLNDSGKIETWVKAHPGASIEARNAFAASLAASGFDLPETYLQRMLRDALDRTKDLPAYDLEFDTQLNKTLDLIISPDFSSTLEHAKTLSERAKEAAAAATTTTTIKPGTATTPAKP